MKAPDKIFILNHEDYSDRRILNAFTEKDNETDIEYIRKDALLDKLNLALKLRGDDNPNINDDGVQTIKAMINYIESL